MTTAVKLQDFYKVNRAWIWISAIIYKGNQLIELKKTSNEKTPNEINLAWKHYYKRGNNSFIRIIEEHFFLNSIIKAERWLKQIELSNDEYQEDIKSIVQLFETAVKNTRDLREHDDEYFCEEPSKLAKNKIEKSEGKILNQQWTGISDNEYYIGSVNIYEIISVAEKILPYLEGTKSDLTKLKKYKNE